MPEAETTETIYSRFWKDEDANPSGDPFYFTFGEETHYVMERGVGVIAETGSAELAEKIVSMLREERDKEEARKPKPGDLCWFGRDSAGNSDFTIHHFKCGEYGDGIITDVRTGQVVGQDS